MVDKKDKKMAWVAVDKDGSEWICSHYTHFVRDVDFWSVDDIYGSPSIEIPRGSIKKLIGRELTWEDDPVELKEEK
jgi:hypothetical protein